MIKSVLCFKMMYNISFSVDPQGLEPRMSVPKTGVLPITPWVCLYFGGANLKIILLSTNFYLIFFI